MSRSVVSDDDPYLPPGEREDLARQLEDCDDDIDDLRRGQGDERRHQQLLVSLERGLHLRRKLHAESSTQVTKACHQLCEAYNLAATRMLQADNLKGARDLLKRAEQVADKSETDRAITWNNLAVFYRRTGKLRSAVNYLERALAIEEHIGNPDAAQTHLNLCATLSQLQRHTDALRHAQSALIRIYETLSPRMMAGDMDGRGGGAEDDTQEQVVALCIAYHNLAVEHEHLKGFESALDAYTNGLRWADKFLEPSHQLQGVLRESSEAVKAKVSRGSGALRRSEDLKGWPDRGASSRRPSRSSDGDRSARSMDRLMTPRGEGNLANVDEEGDSDRGDY